MALLIRHAGKADLPAIVDIYNASIPGRLATADTEPVTVPAGADHVRITMKVGPKDAAVAQTKPR